MNTDHTSTCHLFMPMYLLKYGKSLKIRMQNTNIRIHFERCLNNFLSLFESLFYRVFLRTIFRGKLSSADNFVPGVVIL